MTRAELREFVRKAELYKMSLGKTARYRAEALAGGVLVFQSETRFYDAVVANDLTLIRTAGLAIRNTEHPRGGAPDRAFAIWRRSIDTFRTLPGHSVVLH